MEVSTKDLKENWGPQSVCTGCHIRILRSLTSISPGSPPWCSPAGLTGCWVPQLSVLLSIPISSSPHSGTSHSVRHRGFPEVGWRHKWMKNNSETWGNRVEPHVKKEWTYVKSLDPAEKDMKKSMLMKKKRERETRKPSSLEHRSNIAQSIRGNIYSYLRSQKWELSYGSGEGAQLPVLKVFNSSFSGFLTSILSNHTQIYSSPLTQDPFKKL